MAIHGSHSPIRHNPSGLPWFIPDLLSIRKSRPQRPYHSRSSTVQSLVTRRAILASRTTIGFCLLLAALLIPLLTARAADPASIDPRTMTFTAIDFSSPEPERVLFENGLVVYLLEDHELPLVTISALMRTGGWLDPPDKVGLAALTGTVMRTGGGGGMSAVEIDDELSQFAGRLTVAIGRQSGSASLDVLRKDVKRGLQLFAGLVRTPAFDPDSVELAKLQAVERIRRHEDEPESIANREFVKLLYGSSHPTARESSVESVRRITREDLIAFHENSIHPNGTILGVSGDFSKDEMMALLLEVFGDWERGIVPNVMIAEVTDDEAEAAVVHVINKETSQTHLRVGHLSVKETDLDYVPLVIANDILGGTSFIGRLFNEVRTKHGLAYSVGSELSPGMYSQGMWQMWAETKLPSTKDVLGQLMDNIERIGTELVSDTELAQAKDTYENASVFDCSSSSKLVSQRMKLEYDGLSKDFFQQLRENVRKVSKEDVLAVSRKHLRLDRLKIIAVGSGGTLAKVLPTFGNVKDVNVNSSMHAVLTAPLQR